MLLQTLMALVSVAFAGNAVAETCSNRSGAIGLSRTVEIDTTHGPIFGDITKAAKESTFLHPKEVVLTFDDGPMPWITRSILETLDKHCTKATFFAVGRMAIAYPEMVRTIQQRGHTLGTHTWSHPLNIARLSPASATEEIEKGFAAVALAAGRPIAPFFRFPGLSDSAALLAHLQQRDIASFTVDVVSNDSYIGDPKRLVELTLKRVEARQGGIILFHDIKAATAKALPTILEQLNARGYRVVHMTSLKPAEPLTTYDAELGPRLAKVEVAAGARPLMPFFGSAATIRPESEAGIPTTRISSDAKIRVASTKTTKSTSSPSSSHTSVASASRAQHKRPSTDGPGTPQSWSTVIGR